MEVNFANNPDDTGAQTAEQVAPPSQPAPEPTSPQLPAAPTKILMGDKLPELKDLVLPRLNLTQNLGKATESFDPGTLVYNQQVPLFIPGKVTPPPANKVVREQTAPVIMTFLGFRQTRYYEKTKFEGGGGTRGIIVDTEAAVRAAGGTLDYNEWKANEKNGMKRFEPGVDSMVVIVRPELAKENEADFNFEADGAKLTLAMWNLRGSLYTAACKKTLFVARRMGCLYKGGYPSWSYAVSSREEQWQGGVRSWIPVCVPNKQNSPEFLEFVRSVLEG